MTESTTTVPFSVEVVIETYANRLCHAYPDACDEVIEERDALLSLWKRAHARIEAEARDEERKSVLAILDRWQADADAVGDTTGEPVKARAARRRIASEVVYRLIDELRAVLADQPQQENE